MEQDRTSRLLPHHPQLARCSPGNPRNRRQADWVDTDQHRPGGTLLARPRSIRQRTQSHERRNGSAFHQTKCVSRGVELRDPSAQTTPNSVGYCFTAPYLDVLVPLTLGQRPCWQVHTAARCSRCEAYGAAEDPES